MATHEHRPPHEAIPLLTEIWSQTEALRAGAARRLHDEQAGDIVSLSMDLALVRQELITDTPLARKLDHFRQVLDRVLRTNRELVEIFRPSLLDNIGLIPALRWRLASLCKSHGVSFESSLSQREIAVEKGPALHLYRVTEEWAGLWLTGPGITHLLLTVSQAGSALEVTVEVIGEHIDPPQVAIDLINARAELAGAMIQMERLERGAVLAVTLRHPVPR